MKRALLYTALGLLYLLHNDFWNWHDGSFMMGLPVGMAYHVFYCLAAMAMLTLLVRHAWPRHLEVAEGEARNADGSSGDGSSADRPEGGR